MNALTLARYLVGYGIGFSVFFLLVPYGLAAVAREFSRTAWSCIPFSHSICFGLAVILAVIGLFFVLWSNLALVVTGKGGATDVFNVAISPRTKHLVVTGPYRFTRNPMVFGVCTCYIALALYWNSLPTLVLLGIFFFTMRFYLKTTEEKRLLRDFGQEYEAYQKQVPMIVPWPFPRKRHPQ